MNTDAAGTRRYVVELSLPNGGEEGLAAAAERARAAAEELEREGTPVRYVRSILIPGDETCFHVFEYPAAAEDDARLGSLRQACGASPSPAR